jgi:predicted MFS family arabinose efflux permease
MGYNVSVLSVGTATFPIIGGILATFGWYYPFFLPVLAIPIGLVSLLLLKSPEQINRVFFKDYLFNTWVIVKNRKVVGLFIASIIGFIILYGPLLTYLPLLIEQGFNGSSVIIGLIMATMSITTALISSNLGNLTKRFSEENLLWSSFILYTVALLMIPKVPNIWMLTVAIIIYGIGHGLNIPTIQTLLAGSSSVEERGVIMSLNGMVLRIGQTLGPLVMGIIFVGWGLESTFYMGSILALIMFIIIKILIK